MGQCLTERNDKQPHTHTQLTESDTLSRMHPHTDSRTTWWCSNWGMFEVALGFHWPVSVTVVWSGVRVETAAVVNQAVPVSVI